jgi:hypothetical protein
VALEPRAVELPAPVQQEQADQQQERQRLPSKLGTGTPISRE